MKFPPLKMAAVGLGWVTTHRHIPTMEANRQFEIVGVIDRAPAKAATLAKAKGYRRFAQVE